MLWLVATAALFSLLMAFAKPDRPPAHDGQMRCYPPGTLVNKQEPFCPDNHQQMRT